MIYFLIKYFFLGQLMRLKKKKKNVLFQIGQDLVDKRENRRFTILIDYPCKYFAQSFVNYLGPRTCVF